MIKGGITGFCRRMLVGEKGKRLLEVPRSLGRAVGRRLPRACPRHPQPRTRWLMGADVVTEQQKGEQIWQFGKRLHGRSPCKHACALTGHGENFKNTSKSR
jgi:hypothetical protein